MHAIIINSLSISSVADPRAKIIGVVQGKAGLGSDNAWRRFRFIVHGFLAKLAWSADFDTEENNKLHAEEERSVIII